MPFKIYTLNRDTANDLETLQKENQVNAVTALGRDAEYATYVLVDYDTDVNSCPTPASSGSLPTDNAGEDQTPKDG